MLRRFCTAAVVLVAIALGGPSGASAADCAGADIVPAADNLAAVSQATLCLVNGQRTSHGLRTLRENASLTGASTAYSQRMVAQAFFGHESPDGGTLVSRLTGVRYLTGRDDWVVGENIGWGQGPLSTPRSMVTAWMNSRGHRENILSAEYRDVGLGFALGTPSDSSWGATYTTDFGDPGHGKAAGSRAVVSGAAKRKPAAHKKSRKAVARAACARSAQMHKRGRAARRAAKTCARARRALV
jgi:uncharacterized protein YkwD